ncbi:helix-turn-helix domain-containing protein [Ralstonia insidiosa]|jgi:AraC family transcriptional activator FtrA|uniref:helix-turn-helix domain-containing protein n=1 Tax=Ralstonia TaxID=48736 RepID=UPI0009E215DF|nr:helix-turn-helix domain-containing protein [Ralstonia insidiosa]MBX3772336.1 helix-turn-helix domain-containing protein [Ralstonia pickettii]NOZ16507.1 helix-turn-helix domain-containing protein [Betaproteobacteria bacterium]MBA9856992.1 helix-turn-helix domain-containing protein [Ralstonia insidiosa]MBA9874006.1 helix-turn-helix domain-containing protein [Ralstonia insidiosa]MBA9913396.1 helix-turn-helix domain-containing protein [Ralstonia insidiosa]
MILTGRPSLASRSAPLAATRLEEAKRLLELTALPIETIALQAGFGSVQVLRSHFRKTLRLSPREYRASFAPPSARAQASR